MFANLDALVTLVNTDSQATREEKDCVLRAIRSENVKVKSSSSEILDSVEVVSFDEARRMLGYRSVRGVYAAVRSGRLLGYYGGATGRRASGVLTASIKNRIRSHGRNRIGGGK